MNRRSLLSAVPVLIGGGVAGTWMLRDRSKGDLTASGRPAATPQVTETRGKMPYRAFGSTGLKVSEVSFGSWGIGGRAYGPVEKAEALNALARADEHGCNLVDTAAVYGESETLLGEFLQGKRDRWLISTKYSEQPAGMTATLEEQLRRLRTDVIDIYMAHWAPGRDEGAVYDELYALKKAGKVRFVGVSLKNATDIDFVIDHTNIDCLMVAFSLLDPDPFLARVDRLRASRKAVMVRSSLREGFLTGKFKRDVKFTDPTDQRSTWSPEQVARVVDDVERFRFWKPRPDRWCGLPWRIRCPSQKYRRSFSAARPHRRPTATSVRFLVPACPKQAWIRWLPRRLSWIYSSANDCSGVCSGPYGVGRRRPISPRLSRHSLNPDDCGESRRRPEDSPA